MLFAHLGTLQAAKGNEETEERGLIKIDYSKSISEVYEDIARFVIQSTRE